MDLSSIDMEVADTLVLFNVNPEIFSAFNDMSDDALRAFADLLKESTSSNEIELHIFALFCIFIQTRSFQHADHAFQRAEGWIEAVAPEDADRVRRIQLLDSMTAVTSKLRNILNYAIDPVNIAVDAVPQDHPDQAKCLNNLGFWLGKWFDQTRSLDNLNKVIYLSNTALHATLQGQPEHARLSGNLGVWLGKWFT